MKVSSLVVLLVVAGSASVLGQSSSAGGQFFVPARFYRQPPPSTVYGVPLPPSSTTSTTTTTTTTTTEVPTTTTKEADTDVSGGAVSIANAQSGAYYVLQPDGRLQRIAYAHGPASARFSSSQQQQGYLARFHYQDLEPLGAPIYSYSAPELVRLNK